jgi:acyl-CoA thioester hydrolase
MMHRTPIQIRFVDTDMLGHVNNSNFLSYMEMARVSYFNTILPGLVDWSKEGIILAKAEIQYKKPIFLNDQLFVDIAVDHLSSRSFNMRYRFIRTTDMGEELCAEGNTLMVCYDYVNHSSMSMPESWKKAILAHEGSIG